MTGLGWLGHIDSYEAYVVRFVYYMREVFKVSVSTPLGNNGVGI